MILFLAMVLNLRMNKGSYLCKEVANPMTVVPIIFHM